MSRSLVNKILPYAVIGVAFLITAGYLLTVLPGRSAPAPQASQPAVPHSDGLSDSHEGYLMRPVELPSARGKAIPVSFRILGPDGATLTEYETVQAKPLHLFVIRDDVSGYQHLHPTFDGDAWSSTLDVDDGGSYRLYAEFTPQRRAWLGHPVILGLSFIIPGDTKLAPLPGPAAISEAGAYKVERLDGTSHLIAGQGALLRFGVPGAVLEPYLGAIAHMSAFEVRTMALVHLHPAASELTFHTQFPNRGEYRLFLEFQVDGQVHRAAFTVFAT